jgi:hypothetical protein
MLNNTGNNTLKPFPMVSEELVVKSPRDEIIWSPYASFDQHSGNFVLAP